MYLHTLDKYLFFETKSKSSWTVSLIFLNYKDERNLISPTFYSTVQMFAAV